MAIRRGFFVLGLVVVLVFVLGVLIGFVVVVVVEGRGGGVDSSPFGGGKLIMRERERYGFLCVVYHSYPMVSVY